MKIIILFIVLGAIFLSGCVGNGHTPLKNNTSTATEVTPEVNATSATEVTPEVNATSEITEASTLGTSSNPYIVRLNYYMAIPSSLEIRRGDSVAWINLQDQSRTFTLVSNQGLFNDTNLVFKRSFVYTFNETGDYNFSVLGQPHMNDSINVTAP